MKKLMHPFHALDGYGLVGLGLIIVFSKSYFFWPPFFPWAVLDDCVGIFGIIVGSMMISWGFADSKPVKVQRDLLICACAFWGFEIVAECTHAMVIGRPHMVALAFVSSMGLLLSFLLIGRQDKY